MFDTAEILENNVTIQWNADRSVALVTLTESNRKTVDTYIETNLDIFRKWDKSKPIFTIQDISGGKVTLTPYMKERLKEFTDYVNTNKVTMRTALVMENNFTGQVMRTFGRLFGGNSHYLKLVFFTSIDQAHEWIIKQQQEV